MFARFTALASDLGSTIVAALDEQKQLLQAEQAQYARRQSQLAQHSALQARISATQTPWAVWDDAHTIQEAELKQRCCELSKDRTLFEQSSSSSLQSKRKSHDSNANNSSATDASSLAHSRDVHLDPVRSPLDDDLASSLATTTTADGSVTHSTADLQLLIQYVAPQALVADPRLNQLRYHCVPKHKSEFEFWRLYFTAIEQIREEMCVGPLSDGLAELRRLLRQSELQEQQRLEDEAKQKLSSSAAAATSGSSSVPSVKPAAVLPVASLATVKPAVAPVALPVATPVMSAHSSPRAVSVAPSAPVALQSPPVKTPAAAAATAPSPAAAAAAVPSPAAVSSPSEDYEEIDELEAMLAEVSHDDNKTSGASQELDDSLLDELQ